MPDTLPITGEFGIIDKVSEPKLLCVGILTLEIKQRLLQTLVGKPILALTHLAAHSMLFDQPIMKSLWSGNTSKERRDLPLQVFRPDVSLCAAPIEAAFGAMVVRVATAKSIDLMLCRYPAAALPTPDEGGERKGILLQRRLSFTPQQSLHLRKFSLRHQRRVRTFVHLAIPSEAARVERIDKHAMHIAEAEIPPAHLSTLDAFQTPLAAQECHVTQGVSTSEGQIEQLPNERCTFAVYLDRL